jgi:hypothetical protein
MYGPNPGRVSSKSYCGQEVGPRQLIDIVDKKPFRGSKVRIQFQSKSLIDEQALR